MAMKRFWNCEDCQHGHARLRVNGIIAPKIVRRSRDWQNYERKVFIARVISRATVMRPSIFRLKSGLDTAVVKSVLPARLATKPPEQLLQKESDGTRYR
jgi:hypothetical protein